MEQQHNVGDGVAAANQVQKDGPPQPLAAELQNVNQAPVLENAAQVAQPPPMIQYVDEAPVLQNPAPGVNVAARPRQIGRHRPRYTRFQKERAVRLLDAGVPCRQVAQMVRPHCSSSTPIRWRQQARARAQQARRARDFARRQQAMQANRNINRFRNRFGNIFRNRFRNR